MKEKMNLMGLEEINQSMKEETIGGASIKLPIDIETFGGPICCANIPPAKDTLILAQI